MQQKLEFGREQALSDQQVSILNIHNWLNKDEYNLFKTKYKHPIIKSLEKISEGFKQGHGGMDFVMIYRMIRGLNLGLPLDINVYDSVMWSAITPLSEISVASKSQSIITQPLSNSMMIFGWSKLRLDLPPRITYTDYRSNKQQFRRLRHGKDHQRHRSYQV